MAKINSWLFSDDGEHLDRFGLVLGLSILSASILMLVNLDDATSSTLAELGWFAVTFTVGITLSVSFRTSGVARLPRMIGDIVVWITIAGVVVAAVLDRYVDLGVSELSVETPSPTWAFLALLAPVLVLRRVMMQRFVTTDTLRGAIAVYLLIAVAFNYAFLSLHGISGDLFFETPEPTTAFMYFSLATITTVGYGDLSAVTELGRFLASAEALIGQVLLVVVVARLVSLYGLPNRGKLVPKENDSDIDDG